MEMLTIHKMRPGERLEMLSARYHVPICMIMRANGMTDTNDVIAFKQVKIPKKCYCNRCVCQQQTATKYEIYTVHSTDSVYSIAQKYGITMNIILKTNCIKDPDDIRPGDAISIPILTGKRYTVRANESLNDIARRSGMSVTSIRDKNCMDQNDTVYPGMMLILN